MMLMSGLMYGGVLIILWLSVLLYPKLQEWARWTTGFLVWFSVLSFVTACRSKPFTARFTQNSFNWLSIVAVGFCLAEYVSGVKWCLILAVAIALLTSSVTYLIVRFYPPDPQV